MANKQRDLGKETHWREILKRYASSGLSVRSFCQQEQVTEPTFYAWRRTIRERDDKTKSQSVRDVRSKQPAFAPVVATSERALKRVAIGRKNWLFAGNDAAAENHARLWSLIANCDRHKFDPQRYLTSVLAKISQTPAEELEQFLPDIWKAEDAAEPISTV